MGLTAEDLKEGKKILRGLDAILGERPKVRPPAQFDSGLNAHETALAVENLIEVMNGREREEEEVQQDERDRDPAWGRSWSEGPGVEGEAIHLEEDSHRVVGVGCDLEDSEPNYMLQQLASSGNEDSRREGEVEIEEEIGGERVQQELE
ncbi:hypothetical protein L873DRAFT_1787476 [Choiromyces venosus 120613-1]|uniref:Uncharacterized protein n=1 Tax=Choiromyces venosus 120613-1 TaxID=1336337 RepID=A0A3N4JWS1_9PEZI|nr:hypothetical protein L873DRAFT_1787476 [Choiromyces venosus 120613-1]